MHALQLSDHLARHNRVGMTDVAHKLGQAALPRVSDCSYKLLGTPMIWGTAARSDNIFMLIGQIHHCDKLTWAHIDSIMRHISSRSTHESLHICSALFTSGYQALRWSAALASAFPPLPAGAFLAAFLLAAAGSAA